MARRLGGSLTGFSKASSVAGRFRDFVALSKVLDALAIGRV